MFSFAMFWLLVMISFYAGYCFGKKKMIVPNFNRKIIYEKNYNNGHPSSCTCVDCTNNRLRAKGYIK